MAHDRRDARVGHDARGQHRIGRGEQRAEQERLRSRSARSGAWWPAATITAVSGIASTSLRSGSRQWERSISPSTSSPSRNRITISATVASSLTNPDRARSAARRSRRGRGSKPASTNRAVERHEAAARDARDERPEHQQTAEDERRDLEAVRWRGDREQRQVQCAAHGAQANYSVETRGREERCADNRAGQVTILAGRGRGVQRLPGAGGRTSRCCSTAATACSRSCGGSATTSTSTRS